MKRNKHAISLIVLVITIIVMVILAGAIILTLNNSGIINKAQAAVDATNEATVKEVASLGWAEAYADGARIQEDLKAGVVSALEKNNINTDDYIIHVTTSGVTVKTKSNVWVKNGFTVVKGDQVLEIGDVVNYDETAGGTKTGLTTTEWQVLGADEEGNLLITSSTSVSVLTLGDHTNLAETQKDWLNGIEQLNDRCLPYGYGEGVVGQARSITVEDINSVTGYDPTTYGKGNLYQYGNTVTYKYNGTVMPDYESVVKSGTLTFEHDNGFYYYNGEEFVHITDLTTGTSGNEFAKLKNNAYYYNASDLTTISSKNNGKVFSMLFPNSLPCAYWLASKCVITETGEAFFGMHAVDPLIGEEGVFCYALCSSYGYSNGVEYDVRAVVTLSSDITFTGSSEDGWSY